MLEKVNKSEDYEFTQSHFTHLGQLDYVPNIST